jgi:thiamine-monophosphate kinase
MDISDGLAVDLRRICIASRVGAEIDGDAIPIHSQVREIAATAKVQPWAFSLASGGDFQFMTTVPERYRALAEGVGLFKIGRITAEKRLVLTYRRGPRLIRIRLPEIGHKDRPGQTFAREVRQLISEVPGA